MRKVLIFLAGLLAGSSIGAGISLLFSPKSSDEVREGVIQRVERAREESTLAADQKEADLRKEYEGLIHPNGHSNNGHSNGNGYSNGKI